MTRPCHICILPFVAKKWWQRKLHVCCSSSLASTQTDRQGLIPSKGKGLAFDPLQKPKGKQAHTHAPPATATATAKAAGAFGGFGGGFGAIPPDIADQDDISAGFQRMMAELAQGAHTTACVQCTLLISTAISCWLGCPRFTSISHNLICILYLSASTSLTACGKQGLRQCTAASQPDSALITSHACHGTRAKIMPPCFPPRNFQCLQRHQPGCCTV